MVPSVNVPEAVNCSVSPEASEPLAGVTTIETTAAAATDSVVEPLMLPSTAVIVDVPVASAVARPADEMVAAVMLDDAQVTDVVKSCFVPSV